MSNIDTDSIISQLMAVERRPQRLLASNVTALQKSQSAWQSIADKLAALKTAADTISGLGQAASMVAITSSDPSAVAVRATGAPAAMRSSIEVVALAATHSVLASDAFAAPTASAAGRTLDVTVGDTTHSFSSSDGTIDGLADAVNAAGIGVRASLLQTSPGTYQMVLTSTTSGTANSFTAVGSGWGSFSVARPGADAQVRIDGVTVTRSSNVIDDAIAGVELTVSRVTSAPVTVEAARDDNRIINAVKALVDAANAALSTIGVATKSSADASARGALGGDGTARRLADQIRSVIAYPLTGSGSTAVTAGSLGVSLTRTGTITFDDSTLRAALATDASSVLAALGRGATSTAAGISVVGATSASTPGSRQVVLTQAAARASLAGIPNPPATPGTNVSMSVVTPDGSYLVAFQIGASWAETAGRLNAALRAAGVHITAATQQSAGVDVGLSLTADRYGSAGSFSISGGDDVGLGGAATAGVHAQGTIGGTPFVADGQTYSTGGLVYQFDLTAAQLAAAGGSVTSTVTITDGLAGALSRIGAEGAGDGDALTAKAALADRIADLNTRISRYDDLLAKREATLRRRFTAMETLLAQLQATSSSLGLLSAAPTESS